MFEDIAILELSLSVFLGFISALLVEYIIDQLQERKHLKEALYGMADELTGVARMLKKIDADSYHVDPFETPFWDSLVYGDGPNTKLAKGLRTSIVSTYRSIEHANSWENLRSNSFFYTKERSDMLDGIVGKNREELMGTLARTIGGINTYLKRRADDDETLPLP